MDYKKEIEQLVDLVVNENASDLHLSDGRHPIIRVAGSLIPLAKKSITTDVDMKGYLDVFLNDKNKILLEKDRDVDFSYSLVESRFRGNAYYRQGALSVALRLIPKKIKTLEELNLPPILESFTHKQQGFFLVVGPIGQRSEDVV
jgi:twitching motility protein PilT